MKTEVTPSSPDESPHKDSVVESFRQELRELVGPPLPPAGPAVDPADFKPTITPEADAYIAQATTRHPTSGNAQSPANK